MKKILLLGMAIAMMAAMLGLGVQAQFQDTEAASTKVYAGKLDLKVNGGDKKVEAEYKCVKPGDTSCCQPLVYKLTNEGCVQGELDMLTCVSECENDLVEPECEAGDNTPAKGELGEHLAICLKLDDSSNDRVLYSGLVKNMPSYIPVNEMLPNTDYDLIVECWWWTPSSTDSQAMTDSVKIDLTFTLQQFKD